MHAMPHAMGRWTWNASSHALERCPFYNYSKTPIIKPKPKTILNYKIQMHKYA